MATLPRALSVPSIRSLSAASVNDVVTDLRNWVQTRDGLLGDGLDGVLTKRDLFTLGITSLNKLAQLNGPPGGGIPPPIGLLDGPIPPTPTTLVVTPTSTANILTWNEAAWNNIAYFEVWRGTTNALGSAVLLAQVSSQLYYDPVGPAATFYYWVRAMGGGDQGGPSGYNAALGTVGTTPLIGSGQISSLAADKITAGFINVAIALNAAKVYGAELYAGGTTTTTFDAFGNVTGFTANNPTFQVVGGVATFNATAFLIRNGAGTATPFQVVGGQVLIDTATIQNLTATHLSITDLSTIAANIGTITSGRLQNAGNTSFFDLNATGTAVALQIAGTALQIKANGDAAYAGILTAANVVATNNIQANAATAIQASSNATTQTFTGTGSTGPSTVITQAITTTGSPVLLQGFISYSYEGIAPTTGDTGTIELRILRGATLIYTSGAVPVNTIYTDSGGGTHLVAGGTMGPIFVETPAAGTYTYSLAVVATCSRGTVGLSTKVYSCALVATEIKR